MPVLRCKLKVESVQSLPTAGEKTQENVSLRAVYDGSEDNKQWSKWTPAAQFTLTITNPGAFDKLPVGKEFFVDFTPTE